MKKHAVSLLGIAGGLFMGLLLAAQLAFNEKQNKKSGEPKYVAPKLPEKISFAGEPVPLERWDVRERLDREVLFNYYNVANILYMLKLATRYFPVISEKLQFNGVPDDFKYLCIAESNLQSGAISRSGAVGYWQFMSYTAPGYNLEISSQVDDRHNIEKSSDAACQYIKMAYNKFGSWTAAAAAYNCGQGGYNTAATFQQTTNYYDLQLSEETNR
ncbi:MAG: lytic transglycosylase domain-containing protein, partial [Chitinophagaceae bacterium]|nr:lytic transglycosylase domain-containing protein [Chitinophagaceae bacterium]